MSNIRRERRISRSATIKKLYSMGYNVSLSQLRSAESGGHAISAHVTNALCSLYRCSYSSLGLIPNQFRVGNGTALAQARIAADYTQAELAAYLQVSESTYREWECGKTAMPSYAAIPLIDRVGLSRFQLELLPYSYICP